MSAVILPYRSCDLDGGFAISLPDESSLEVERSLLGRTMAIAADAGAGSFTLEFNLTPPVDWRLCVPPEERNEPPVVVAVRLISRREQYRELIRLERSGLTWSSQVTLPVPELGRGDYQAEAMFIRSRPGESGQGFAWRRGQIIARSRPWHVSVSPQTAAAGNFADVCWMDFRSGEYSAHPDALYAVEVGERPVILLNRSCRTALYRLLMNQGRRRHVIPAARDTLFGAIAGGVWTALLSRSLVELHTLTRDADPGELDPALLGVLPPWARMVLEEFLPILYPECGEDVLAERLVADSADATALARLLTGRVPPAVQSHTGLMRAASLMADCLSGAIAEEPA